MNKRNVRILARYSAVGALLVLLPFGFYFGTQAFERMRHSRSITILNQNQAPLKRYREAFARDLDRAQQTVRMQRMTVNRIKTHMHELLMTEQNLVRKQPELMPINLKFVNKLSGIENMVGQFEQRIDESAQELTRLDTLFSLVQG